jgi:hypothetical protein
MVLAVNWAPQEPADGRRLFDFEQFRITDSADRVLADRLEHVLHGDLPAAIAAGRDRTAIDEDRRYVEPPWPSSCGQRLVAAREAASAS